MVVRGRGEPVGGIQTPVTGPVRARQQRLTR